MSLRQPNGPSYAFFAPLLPPLRYVETRERHYPICLSAPFGPVKSRYVGNGAGINLAPGVHPERWTEYPIGARVLVGLNDEQYGQDFSRLDGPRYESGFLPIVINRYKHGDATIAQEAFAPVDSVLADHAAVLVRFSVEGGQSATPLAIEIEAKAPPMARDGMLLDASGRCLAWFGGGWAWNAARNRLSSSLTSDQPRFVAIFSKPLASPTLVKLDDGTYQAHRKRCEAEWTRRIGNCAAVDVPEDVVNRAWKSLIVANLMMATGDEMRYSAGNQYARLFEAESGDALRSLLLFGLLDDAMRMVDPLLAYKQEGLRYHDAAFKLQMLAHVYWLTRDAEFVRSRAKQWRPSVGIILSEREKESGLLPKENYCGDIATQVYSLNSNANGWRALHDVAAMLRDMGDVAQAEPIEAEAAKFREVIVKAIDKSEVRGFDPAFIPVALFGAEKPYEVLTDTMVGSYWNLMMPYILGSGILDPRRERAVIDTFHTRGGLAMGMVRFHQHSGLYANENGIDDLYTQRYAQALLRRDEGDDVDRVLAGFYGKLAHGMTRDSFVGGEGSSLIPLDANGRPMYLPPNASGSAYFLTTLRELLVQDVDADADGSPNSLRLLFGTPRAWLEDGKTIRCERMPSVFGPVSVVAKSDLMHGKVTVDIAPPPRVPKSMRLRIRLPDGSSIASATIAGGRIEVPKDATVELSANREPFRVTFDVARDQK
jgi:hypothetical protein